MADEQDFSPRFSAAFETVLASYARREAELSFHLLVLTVPVLLMLAFYLFMVSQLMVRGESGVVAVLESRGAGRPRILGLYGIEGLLLALPALVAGPLAGTWMVRVIGASGGFLEFVDRKALPVALDGPTLLTAAVAACLSMAATLLPVLSISRTTIVLQRRVRARPDRAPLWERLFLDVLLLGIGLYALYRLNAELDAFRRTGEGGTDAQPDFLLFLASTIFLLGSGLLFLRLYPILLRILYRIGRGLWGPALYASFHQLLHAGNPVRFLMLFLILALSVGLFSANAARTLNGNREDNIRCRVGADIRLQERWTPYDANGDPIYGIDGSGLGGGGSGFSGTSVPSDGDIRYVEPDFDRFWSLEGVDHAARVFRAGRVSVSSGSLKAQSGLMAVDPRDFAQVAWTAPGLNPHSLTAYMNILIRRPDALLLSTDLRDTLGLSVGDPVEIAIGAVLLDGVAAAFVDTWPGYRPVLPGPDGRPVRQALVVGHLERLYSRMPMTPYEVWLKRAPGTSDKPVYDALPAAGIAVVAIESANQQVALDRNDPMNQGTNGALTLGFLVSMMVCGVGFLIHWILSVRGRTLQFGVYRAMGLGRRSVAAMLLWEQLLVSGTAILAGLLLGSLASRLYLPLFLLAGSDPAPAIPFRVLASGADRTRILLVLGGLLLACFLLLLRMVLRIRIHQAVKLGEE